MSYFQSSDDSVTSYEPNSRHVTLFDNPYIGMVVRFSHPDYSYNGQKATENLSLNHLYVVQDYMVYSNEVWFIFSKFPGITFDSKLFTNEKNNYIIPFGRRRTKFYYEKIKLRATNWFCRR